MSSRKYCEAIMDGLLLFTPTKQSHFEKLEDLLKALCKNGLKISPKKSYINAILSCLSSRKYCEAIMDDLLLFMPTKQSQFYKLKDLLKALCKNGFKNLPKKCQLFRTELQYMGNTIFIKDRRVQVKPLRSRLEAIQRLKHLTIPKSCKSFAGIVNFISTFCPELQKLTKPFYDLTRKGRLLFGDGNNKLHLKKSRVGYKISSSQYV